MTFREIAAPYTMTGEVRMKALEASLRRVIENGIPGDFVETGVWRGGNLLLAGLIFKDMGASRHVWGYDTFTGMDKPTEHDPERVHGMYAESLRPEGSSWCYASYDEVDTLLREHLEAECFTLVKGRVEDTLQDGANIPERICMLRLDTDWYTSYKATLETLYPRLTVGGVLILDDYGHWDGARKAVDNYFQGQEIQLDAVDAHCRMMVKHG